MRSERDTLNLLAELERIAAEARDASLPLDQRTEAARRALALHREFRERFSHDTFEVVTVGGGDGRESPFDLGLLGEGSR